MTFLEAKNDKATLDKFESTLNTKLYIFMLLKNKIYDTILLN